MNLVCTIEIERMGAFDWDRDAVPIKRDPLLHRGARNDETDDAVAKIKMTSGLAQGRRWGAASEGATEPRPAYSNSVRKLRCWSRNGRIPPITATSDCDPERASCIESRNHSNKLNTQ